jgi:hypothetical protein
MKISNGIKNKIKFFKILTLAIVVIVSFSISEKTFAQRTIPDWSGGCIERGIDGGIDCSGQPGGGIYRGGGTIIPAANSPAPSGVYCGDYGSCDSSYGDAPYWCNMAWSAYCPENYTCVVENSYTYCNDRTGRSSDPADPYCGNGYRCLENLPPPPICSIGTFTADDGMVTSIPYNTGTTLRFSLSESFPWVISLLQGLISPSPSSGTDSGSTSATGNLTATQIYRLTCNNDNNIIRDVTVNVASPADCVGSWGTCVLGSQTYTITTAQSGTGTACPFSNGAIQNCGTPSCSYAGPDGDVQSATSGTRRVYVYGASSGVASVTFPTWSDYNGQDDISPWYEGINTVGGTWYADINLARHANAGTVNVHAYLRNASGVLTFCDSANYINACSAPLTQNVSVACDLNTYGYAATSGQVTRSQTKSAYPSCTFPTPVTSANSTYVSDNCVYPAYVVGSCSASHYSCSSGTSVNNVSGANSWTWNCNGSGGGGNTSCLEMKPVDCVGDWGTCSNSSQTYTITTPAAYGGTTCPHTNGLTQTCGTACVGSWVESSTCSLSCGGGVKQQVYTVTIPASGGGTACPYINGATQWGSTSCNTQVCTCSAPLTQNVTVACDANANGYAATSGSVTRVQDKSAYPSCTFPTPVTSANSTYVSDNCTYPSFTITPSVVGNGTISPNTAQPVSSNLVDRTKTFTITPAINYTASVSGTCPAGSLVGNTYTTGTITADCTIIVTFTLSACGNGAIDFPTCNTCAAGFSLIGGVCVVTPVNPACGARNAEYAFGDTSYPVGSNYCDSGSAVNFSPNPPPSFPAPGDSVTWFCDNGVSLNGPCTAHRSFVTHTQLW